MKTLFLIRGLPGAGKTTLAHWLYNLLHTAEDGWGDDLKQAVCVAADDYMVDEEGNYKWQPEMIGSCHDACYSEAMIAMDDGVENIIVHNTFTREKEMQPYIHNAVRCGYHIIRLVVEDTHGAGSVHNVPDTTREKMRNRFSLKL